MAFTKICAKSDLQPGDGLCIEQGPEPVGLFNVDGEFFAIDDTCTHCEWSLCEGYLDGDEVECTLYMGRFSVRTGVALAAPAHTPVKVYPVKIEDEQVMVDLTAGRYAAEDT